MADEARHSSHHVVDELAAAERATTSAYAVPHVCPRCGSSSALSPPAAHPGQVASRVSYVTSTRPAIHAAKSTTSSSPQNVETCSAPALPSGSSPKRIRCTPATLTRLGAAGLRLIAETGAVAAGDATDRRDGWDRWNRSNGRNRGESAEPRELVDRDRHRWPVRRDRACHRAVHSACSHCAIACALSMVSALMSDLRRSSRSATIPSAI